MSRLILEKGWRKAVGGGRVGQGMSFGADSALYRTKAKSATASVTYELSSRTTHGCASQDCLWIQSWDGTNLVAMHLLQNEYMQCKARSL